MYPAAAVDVKKTPICVVVKLVSVLLLLKLPAAWQVHTFDVFGRLAFSSLAVVDATVCQ